MELTRDIATTYMKELSLISFLLKMSTIKSSVIKKKVQTTVSTIKTRLSSESVDSFNTLLDLKFVEKSVNNVFSVNWTKNGYHHVIKASLGEGTACNVITLEHIIKVSLTSKEATLGNM
jgi:hypothetical protein